MSQLAVDAVAKRGRIMRSSGFSTTPSQVAPSADMPTFQALSYGEKRRVTRLVAKGEAPHDPRMAVGVTLANVGQLVFNPMLRPKNVARSLEASRRVSVAGD